MGLNTLPVEEGRFKQEDVFTTFCRVVPDDGD